MDRLIYFFNFTSISFTPLLAVYIMQNIMSVIFMDTYFITRKMNLLSSTYLEL